jgi:hypothetical protein
MVAGKCPLLARSCRSRVGRACPLCPGTSDVDLLSYGERIIYLDAEIAHSALDLRMAEEQLDGTQVASAAIDEGGLRPA